MESYQQQYLKEMGVEIWLERKAGLPEFEDVSVGAAVSNGNELHVKSLTPELDSLAKQVAICRQCSLYETRTQTVFGVGNPNADWLVIGEAPGADEDQQGEPFVGRAGKLLDAMLLAMGLQREQVFIANILKCRPPNNRDPKLEEVIACESYLRQQINLIQPKIILAVGRIAAQNLLKVDTPIGKMRGNRYQYPNSNLPVFVTYHPAYLLRSPREKRKVWEDLKIAMQVFKELE
jgi:uracil-DNA glycosylase